MSSPLDGRIRSIARDEAQQAIQGVGVLDTTALDAQGLQQQITDLHEHLHHVTTMLSRVEKRLDVVEQTSGQTSQEQPEPVRRSRRKTVDG